MRLRLQMLFVLVSAAALLVPVVGITGAQAVSAACVKSAAWTRMPSCVIKTSSSAFAETGLGACASSVAFVPQVECKPVFAEQKVQINTSQLNNACYGTLSWYSAAATGGQAPGTGTGESFTVVLDHDGNATAVVWGGPSCASGETFGQVDLVGPACKTLTTNFRVLSPRVTA